jgi:glycosyltransferase involved in cell wall biosynthesis
MNVAASTPTSRAPALQGVTEAEKPLVSLILPAFNEEAILEKNFDVLLSYIQSQGADFDWEIILINDGSSDRTGEIVDGIGRRCSLVRVFHHAVNFGLGQALKFGFGRCRGDYVVTFDVDLSYSPEHIGQLLEVISSTNAKLVLASPYMAGGKISNVPMLRRVLSVGANRFLSLLARGRLSTLTCMVRAYDGHFIRNLNLRATGMDVMAETVYKAMVLNARIEQVPAHLDWGLQQATDGSRQSSMRIFRHIVATVLSGFIFKPFIFFVFPGLLLLGFSAYVNIWMIIHFVNAYSDLAAAQAEVTLSQAVAVAYAGHPHTFIVGLLSMMLAIQLLSLGILALQSKSYFEEIFHLGSTINRRMR